MTKGVENGEPPIPNFGTRVADALQRAHLILKPDVTPENWPTLCIAPLSKRHDSDLNFRERLEKEREQKPQNSPYYYQHPDDEFSVLVVPAAAPHTLPISNEQTPTHYTCWWFGPNGERLDMLGLAAMEDDQRKAIIEKLAEATEATVNFMTDQFGISDEDTPHLVKIYGLTGHATAAERIDGFSPGRGGQSNKHGHFNISYIDPQETKRGKRLPQEPLTPKEMLKQIDPVSEAIMRRFGVLLRPMIRRFRNYLKEKGYTSFNYDLVFDHKVDESKLSGIEVRFADYLMMEFAEPIPLATAYEILALFYSPDWFGGLYDTLWNFYEEYHLAEDASAKEEIIAATTTELLNRVNEEDRNAILINQIHSLLREILLIPPSYGQIERWINQKNISEEKRDRLARKLKHYQWLDSVLNYPENEQEIRDNQGDLADETLEMLANAREKYVDGVRRYYGLTDSQVAEELIIYWADLVKDPKETYNGIPGWQTITNLFSRYLSTSYKIDYKIGSNGEIEVTKISISPKLATTKGGAEDLQGVKLERPTAY